MLALYTDGITEAEDDAGEEFGGRCPLEGLQRHRGLPCQGLLAEIVEEVREFSANDQHDDITLIIAKSRAGECLPAE